MPIFRKGFYVIKNSVYNKDPITLRGRKLLIQNKKILLKKASLKLKINKLRILMKNPKNAYHYTNSNAKGPF